MCLKDRLPDKYRFITLAVRENIKEKDFDEICRIYHKIGDEKAWEVAYNHEVEAIVAHRMMEIGLVNRITNHWALAHDKADVRMRLFHETLDDIGRRMAHEGIRIVALKNAGISRGLYPCPACCPMGDLDCLVSRKDFISAHKIMLDMGFALLSRSPIEPPDLAHGLKFGGCEYFKRINGHDLWIEIQWRPIGGRWISPDQEQKGDVLIERSRPISGTDVRILSPVDNLIQVALHTAKHSYVRAPGFRLHMDVDRVVKRQSPEWVEVIDEVKRYKVKVPIFFSFIIPKIYLETDIPEWVLDAIKPDLFRLYIISFWLAQIGLFEPKQRKFGYLDYMAFGAILHDDLMGVGRAIFPSLTWMKENYHVQGLRDLIVGYGNRFLDLLFRRNL